MDIANSSETYGTNTKEVARGTPDETSDETSLEHHLEEATKSWERNKYLTTSGQRTLLDYFTGSAPPRPPPRNIAREAREHADIGVLRLEHDQVRIDNVLNPVE